LNYDHVQQERLQSAQKYRDQIMYRKGCEQLGIKVGASENRSTNMLKRMKITDPTQQQTDVVENKLIEKHHAFLFLLGADE